MHNRSKQRTNDCLLVNNTINGPKLLNINQNSQSESRKFKTTTIAALNPRINLASDPKLKEDKLSNLKNQKRNSKQTRNPHHKLS
uniref:Uncharacterized protein n=1 Tax=Rhizophora mucronata TaxID=61149 RepID=A0A2P2NRB9_RHIMU